MKKKAAILLCWLFLAGLACDDISRAPKDPRAPVNELKPVEPITQDASNDKFSKVGLIQTYNLIVETRNTLTAQAAKLEILKQSKDQLYYVERAKFLEWIGHRNAVLRIREEALSPGLNSYPHGHPAGFLVAAIRAESLMIDYYIYHFQLDRDLPPNIDAELKRCLDEFQEKMKTWKWPVEEQKPPTIQR